MAGVGVGVTVLELSECLIRDAKEYLADPNPIARNAHMHDRVDEPALHVRRAIVVSFINAVMRRQGMDLALYDKDLRP